MHTGSIVILDFGGQYAHLIARRIRQCGAYSEILPPETSKSDLRDAAGIILSGGPQSVYDSNSPQGDPGMFTLGVPVLGICYGLQWMVHMLGGKVSQGKVQEYGQTKIRMTNEESRITKGLPEEFTVWMSHGDEAVTLPEGFEPMATSDACKNVAFENSEKKLFALQFHPEVTHTEHGQKMLENFVKVCDAAPWSMEGYKEFISDLIRKEVGDRNVFMLVSGGVDSTVAFTLLNEVLGSDRVQGLLVDTGLMRKKEVTHVQEAFEKIGMTNLNIEDASQEFMKNLKGITDPEEKRRVIGETFLQVQQRVCGEMGLKIEECPSAGSSRRQGYPSRLGRAETDGRQAGQTPLCGVWMLGQGTIYPDTIETGGTKHASHIKTHHNRVEAVQKMIDDGRVIEPLKDLYKDEVRELGEELGLPHELVWRHPFPGPGLGVRILCAQDVEPTGMQNLELDIEMPYRVLPLKSVGVQGDQRSYKHAVVLFSNSMSFTEEHWKLATEIPNTYPQFNRVLLCTSHSEPGDFVVTSMEVTGERADLLQEADSIVDEEMRRAGLYGKIWQFPVVLLPVGLSDGGQSIVLRPVESEEAMTANAAKLPVELTQKMTGRISALDGIDMVFYDLTNKPPATIEWE